MKTPILVIISLLTCSLSAQRFIEPDKMKVFNVTVNYPEYTVKTQMLKEPKQFAPDVDLTYHWYTSQKIMETKGGFDGKLLHGKYRSFYLNDQLFESGEFKYGVKSGEWKNWYPDGKLKEITNWKKGRKNGSYALYSDYGKLMAKGRFKNDLLTGTFTTYDTNGNSTSKRKYKKGKEIVKQPKVKKPEKDTIKKGEAEPKKEKKGLFGRKKALAEPEEKTGKGQEKTGSKKNEAKPSAPTEKRSFGDRLRSVFKKKQKTETSKKADRKNAVTT